MNKSQLVKIFAIIVACIEMLFFSGIIYGINSIFPVFKNESLFFEYCSVHNSSTINKTNACLQQNEMFGYILITAVASQSLVAFPLGMFFDKVGQKWTKMVGGVTFLIGCVFFYFSNSLSFLTYFFAAFLGITTQSLLNCNLSLASLFPKCQNRITSLMSGSLDSSSIVFMFVSLSYSAGVNIFSSILALGICGFSIMMFSAFCLLFLIDRKSKSDKQKIELAVSQIPDEMDSFLKKNNKVSENSEKGYGEDKQDNLKNNDVKNYQDILHNYLTERYPTLVSALFSRQYLLQLLYFTLIFFRFTFSLAQLSLQLEIHFPSEDQKINGLLYSSSFFLMCGMLISPFAGLIVDCLKQRVINRKDFSRSGAIFYDDVLKCFVLPLIICCVSNLAMSGIIMLPYSAAVYVTYVLITVSRAFLFSLNSSFILQAFPGKYFGKLFGGTILVSGLVSFIQYGLLFRNPLHLRIVNFVLIFLSSVGFVHPLVLWCSSTVQSSRNLN